MEKKRAVIDGALVNGIDGLPFVEIDRGIEGAGE